MNSYFCVMSWNPSLTASRFVWVKVIQINTVWRYWSLSTLWTLYDSIHIIECYFSWEKGIDSFGRGLASYDCLGDNVSLWAFVLVATSLRDSLHWSGRIDIFNVCLSFKFFVIIFWNVFPRFEGEVHRAMKLKIFHWFVFVRIWCKGR